MPTKMLSHMSPVQKLVSLFLLMLLLLSPLLLHTRFYFSHCCTNGESAEKKVSYVMQRKNRQRLGKNTIARG